MSVWLLTSEFKNSRFLLIYCIICSMFCVHFIHVAEHNYEVCGSSFASLAPSVSPFTHQFPRKIWQTSRTSPAGLESDDRKAIQSWVKSNQKYRYEILTQHSAESYVRDKFAHKPDIVEVFTDLQDPILRADLIRYLVLLGDGGVYSDIDTIALKPIEDWVPVGFQKDVSLVVGIEYDVLDGGRWVDWTLDLQIATWAVMAKPGHLFLEITVDRVINRLKNLAHKQGTTISGVKPSFHEVLDTTGPATFTGAVFEGLSYITGAPFDAKNITGLTQPRLIDDVLILPINAFGSGQAHSNSGSPDSDTALVQHLFRGSWKSDHKFAAAKNAEELSEAKPRVENEVMREGEASKGTQKPL